MKKIFLYILFSILALTSVAETQWYNSKSYAYRYENDYGYWTDWTDWLSCDINIKIDTNEDVVVIYSNKTQIYVVYETGDSWTDSSGGQQVSFKVIDQDYDKGTMRLRIESNGNSQIYIDFANVSWVYNVRRIR